MKEEIESMLRLMAYSWEQLRGYEELTPREKGLILEETFERLRGALGDPESYAELVIERFITWREDVDADHVLDTFDLALGFFSGAGLEHELALELAREAAK